MADEDRRIGQEGSRWINVMPSGEELAKWFKDNVAIHDKLDGDNYVQGITLIPNTEKAKAVVGWDSNDYPIIEQRENLVYTPYAKVETRIKYWNDLLLGNNDWLGVVEPVPPLDQPRSLPSGFFSFSVQGEKNEQPVVYRFIACSMKVTIFEKDTVEEKLRLNNKTGETEVIRTGKKLFDPAPGTKMVPMLGRFDADENSLMKAETGAIGRALGMAGMLVIPGTGVATAEDMQEALSDSRPAPTPEDAALPPSAPAATAAVPEAADKETLQDLRQQAVHIINLLKTEFPDTFNEFAGWAKERGIGEVAKVDDARVLQGMIAKADRELTNERGNAAQAADVDVAPAEDPPPETA